MSNLFCLISQKGSSERKEGNKFFPCSVEPFQKGLGAQETYKKVQVLSPL